MPILTAESEPDSVKLRRQDPTLIFRCWLAAGLLWLGGCGTLPGDRGRSEFVPVLAPTLTGPSRDFLFDGFDEDLPAFVHAYIILRDDPSSPAEKLRYSSLALAFWKGLCGKDPLNPEPHVGIAYWPLRGLDPGQAQLALEHGDWTGIVDHYHHERARLILERLNGLPGVGPHLVIAFQALGQAAQPFALEPYPVLILDFSVVPVEKFLPVLQIIQTSIQENREMGARQFPMAELEGYLRPLLGSETEHAIRVLPNIGGQGGGGR